MIPAPGPESSSGLVPFNSDCEPGQSTVDRQTTCYQIRHTDFTLSGVTVAVNMFMYVTFLVCLCLGQTESTLKQCTDAEQGEVSTCYQLVKSRRNWLTAKSECQQRGMALASIGSPEEMSTIRSMLSSYDSPNIWIGLSRNNGQWEWLDGSPVNNVAWAPGQPQNAGEDCGAYWGDHDIHDVGCHRECHFLCEDHTGVTTAVDHCASSPCGDNGECSRTWTGHVCSCHVGYTGTSCDIESTLKQCTDAEQGEVSTCYQLVKSRRNWLTAKSECQQRGMALASIGSPEEMSTIRSILGSYRDPNIWVGLHRNNGHWEWLDGSSVNTVAWGPGQPQDAGEDCGAYWKDNDVHDVDCRREIYFLCEEQTLVTTAVDHCASSPCGDNGECSRTWTGHVCSCHVGYTGTSCDIEIDHCASSPCGDTADCFSHSAGYLCSCRPGFSGPNCDIAVPCNAGNLTVLDDSAWPPNWLLPVIMGMAALELTIIVILLVVMRCCFKRANEKPNKRTITPKGIPLRTPSNSYLDQSDYQIPDPEDAIPRVQCSGEEAELYENPTNDYVALEDRAEDGELYEVV